MWVILLGIINIILLMFFLKFIVLGEIFIDEKGTFIQKFREHFLYIVIIIGVVTFHLIEVNFIDPAVTEWIGYDYAKTVQSFEGDIVYWFSQYWTPALVYFFVIIYIAVYPFTLWFSPFYFIWSNKKKTMKSLSYGLLMIYIVALPFYLFVPITNVYTYFNVESALESVIPSVESFFYSTTTHNNCLPSLHTAMTILVAYCLSLTGNKKFTYFGYFIMISVIISVIYLSIHWITDVLTGTILALAVIFLLKRYIRD